jgi:hypothetical protein
MRRIGFAGLALAMVFSVGAGSAWAESTTTICVPEASSKPVLSTNTKGECPSKGAKASGKYKSVQLPGTGGLEALNKILPHVNYLEKGVAGKPTIQFSGVNVQVVSGSGLTSGAINGEGNLIIGYDENAGNHQQTGSHNLVLGEEQTFTSYGGILGGRNNTVSGPFSSASGGGATASGEASSVSGGVNNIASGNFASISGGVSNNAIAEGASVSGGGFSTASGEYSSVSGGGANIASRIFASISGGVENKTSGIDSSVSGGFRNTAEGKFSSIFGGKELTARNEYEAIP